MLVSIRLFAAAVTFAVLALVFFLLVPNGVWLGLAAAAALLTIASTRSGVA